MFTCLYEQSEVVLDAQLTSKTEVVFVFCGQEGHLTIYSDSIGNGDANTCFTRELGVSVLSVNVETNAGWVGDDYTSATTDLHVGFEGEAGAASYYIQAGPAIVAVDGEETDTQFSGKAGVGVPVSDAIGVYGELSFLTAEDDDDFGVGGKLGVKYNF